MNNNLVYKDLNPTLLNFKEEVLRGLSLSRKVFPPQFFFNNKRGSDIFTKICQLEEYYITRTEVDILTRNRKMIAEIIGKDCLLIEYGSGSIDKVYPLIDALETPHTYIPIDIAKEHLLSYGELTNLRYPALDVVAIAADFTKDNFSLPAEYQTGVNKAIKNKVILFAGSTIGNFTYKEAVALLKQSARLLNGQGGMLIGVDLKKDPNLLHAAYNDREGLTADFNLNILEDINEELGADFDTEGFYHYAPYNPTIGRIELHLVSKKAQTVTIDGQQFSFKEGESIHTENSHKYSVADFRQLAQEAGFELAHTWIDEQQLFSVHYIKLK